MLFDRVDYLILRELTENSRISLKDLSKRVSMSSPSVSERLRRLEERGVIRSYTVDLDPLPLGYSLQAIVRIKPFAGMLKAMQQLIIDTPEITECDKVTGEDCFICRLQLRSMAQLDEILDNFGDKAETNTSIVKSSPVRRRLPPLRTEVAG